MTQVSDTFNIENYFEAKAKSLVTEGDTALLGPSLNGSVREKFARNFLEYHLPFVKIHSGIAFDINGVKSNPLDIIVADPQKGYSISLGQSSAIPVEAILAVFEVKTELNPSCLDKAQNQLKQVNKLTTSTQCVVQIIKGPLTGPPTVPSMKPLLFILAFKTGRYNDILMDLEYLEKNVNWTNIDGVILLDRGGIIKKSRLQSVNSQDLTTFHSPGGALRAVLACLANRNDQVTSTSSDWAKSLKL